MPCKLWDAEAIHTVVITCIILHSMTIEDERYDDNIDDEYLKEAALLFLFVVVQGGQEANFPNYTRQVFGDVFDLTMHRQL